MKSSKQIVGNAGLFYVCYELSKRGWNCLPTTRNAKGVDVVIYSQDAKKSYTIQVKALSKRNPVPFGKKPNLIADFVAVVINVMDEEKLPEVFIIKTEDVKKRLHKGEKNGRVSYWLQPKDYEEYKGKWEIIGDG